MCVYLFVCVLFKMHESFIQSDERNSRQTNDYYYCDIAQNFTFSAHEGQLE